jgi:hypothetical protein
MTEDEKIEVSPITWVYSNPPNARHAVVSIEPFVTKKWPYEYQFFTIEKLTSEQLDSVKQAIESILNN